jgi:hypothetical protein
VLLSKEPVKSQWKTLLISGKVAYVAAIGLQGGELNTDFVVPCGRISRKRTTMELVAIDGCQRFITERTCTTARMNRTKSWHNKIKILPLNVLC